MENTMPKRTPAKHTLPSNKIMMLRTLGNEVVVPAAVISALTFGPVSIGISISLDKSKEARVFHPNHSGTIEVDKALLGQPAFELRQRERPTSRDREDQLYNSSIHGQRTLGSDLAFHRENREELWGLSG